VAIKVTGPGSGVPGSAPVGGGAESAPAPDGASFPEKLKSASLAPLPGTTGTAAPPGGLNADVAADLEAGRIGAGAAVHRVIERIVDRQVGVDAPPAVREKIRAALEDALADDPMLADKIRSLG
jgi:hypothetical protein